MNRTRVGVVATGTMVWVALAAGHVRADSILQPNKPTGGLMNLNGRLVNLTATQPSGLLYSPAMENKGTFSLKGEPISVGITGFPVPSDSATIPNPEPATMLLLGTGLTGLGWAMRRKRRVAGKKQT